MNRGRVMSIGGVYERLGRLEASVDRLRELVGAISSYCETVESNQLLLRVAIEALITKLRATHGDVWVRELSGLVDEISEHYRGEAERMQIGLAVAETFCQWSRESFGRIVDNMMSSRIVRLS